MFDFDQRTQYKPQISYIFILAPNTEHLISVPKQEEFEKVSLSFLSGTAREAATPHDGEQGGLEGGSLQA